MLERGDDSAVAKPRTTPRTTFTGRKTSLEDRDPGAVSLYAESGGVSRELRIQLASLAPIPTGHRSAAYTLLDSDGVAARPETPVPGTLEELDGEIVDGPGGDAVVLASIRPGRLTRDGIESLPAFPSLTVPEVPAVPLDPLKPLLTEGDWVVEKVRKGDTVSQIFDRVGISTSEAYALVEVEGASPLKNIQPGDEIHLVKRPAESDGERERLGKLKIQLDRFTTLLVLGEEGEYSVHTVERHPEIRYRTARATIWDSLLGSARDADIPYDVVYSMATILGWQVDFAKDIKAGDQFTVIYEELYLDGNQVGEGEVVAAELITGERNLRAVRHVDEEGHATYYAPDGDGIQGSFLRNPIRFARVTSKFSKRRLHPILKKWKAHNGVDYGAPMKTPVRATGDGMVHFAGTRKGYGRTIVLKHGEKYETLYAHLNHFRKGLRSGSRVKQGEIIGYVGRTGWATGPHLHYEFRVNGMHMNPLTVELPSSAPIEPKYREDFRRNASQWVAALEDADRISLVRNEN